MIKYKTIPYELRFHIKMPYKNDIIFQQIETGISGIMEVTNNQWMINHLKDKLNTMEQKASLTESQFFCNNPIPSQMLLTNELFIAVKTIQNETLKENILKYIIHLESAYSQLIRNTSIEDGNQIMQLILKIVTKNLLQSNKVEKLISDVNKLWYLNKEEINIKLKIQFINFKLEKCKVLFKYHAFKKNNIIINGYVSENHTRIFIPSDDKTHAQTTRSFFRQKGLHLGKIVTTTPFVQSNDNQHYDVQFICKK